MVDLGMALVAVGMMGFGSYYFLKKKTKRKRALFCKAAATSLPGIILIQNMASGQQTAERWWIFAALLMYMTADVLLECRFVWGAVCFSLGHICMTASFFMGKISPYRMLQVLFLFFLFTVAAFTALRKYIPYLKNKKLFYPAVLYIAILGFMSSAAVSAGVLTGGCSGAALAAGGISFLISDILLGQNRLGKRRSRIRGAAVLILYYLSVFLFVYAELV